MIPKFYSEVTKKYYDSEADCKKAENEVSLKKSERKARADEVEKAMKEAKDANKKAQKLLADFCKDYGTFYHSSTKTDDVFDPFDWFTDFFLL